MNADADAFVDGGRIVVVADDTPESEDAMVFACALARRFGAGVLLVRAYRRPGGVGHWVGVRRLMEQEAQERAERALDAFAERVRALSGRPCARLARPGGKVAVTRAALEADKDARLLVIAASARARRPGPLVAAAGKGAFCAPTLIVPPQRGARRPA